MQRYPTSGSELPSLLQTACPKERCSCSCSEELRGLENDLINLVSKQGDELQGLLKTQQAFLSTVTECFAKLRQSSSPRQSSSAGTSPCANQHAMADVCFVRIAPPETTRDTCSPVQAEHHAPVLLPGDTLRSLEECCPKPSKESRWSRVVLRQLSSNELIDYGKKLLQNPDYKVLDVAVGILVTINTFVMMAMNEYQGYEAAVALGLTDTNAWEGADVHLGLIEKAFGLLFGVELIIRVAVQRLAYFRKCTNLIDMLVVVISLSDLFFVIWQGFTSNIFMIRLVRTLKLARAFRVMRTLRLFEGLRVLVHAVSTFLPSVMWSMVFLFVFMVMGGILLSGLLDSFIMDASQEYDQRLWVWRHYGTSLRATYTMFEVTFAGNWPVYARPLLEHVSSYYALFFLVYIVFVVFAVMRVITAIFLKETMDAAQNDAEMVVREKARASKEYACRVSRVFDAIDSSKDGIITEDEFLRISSDQTIRSYMQALDLDLHDGALLFSLLDDGDGQLTYDEFVTGCQKFKGHARAIDMKALRKEVENMKVEILGCLHHLGRTSSKWLE